MEIEIREEPTAALARYATVSIAFEVRESLAVLTPDRGLGGLQLVAREVPVPYMKDYGAEPGNHPTDWASRFDVTPWGVLAAWTGGARAGGAVVAWRTPGLEMSEGRDDLAVLWDLRVAPGARGQGIGSSLFRLAEGWAVARGARWLKIETQNINVPASRFYAGMSCTLGAVNRFAYPSLPEEMQLLWYKELGAGS